ncbi:diphosphate--fructose-6-phosphate 1-phosphotransferase [Sphaerochaeta globosa]|uniref:Pyrophosphate--fructose 6-phosphate 1-phosphotransferase n=1 Tax=Sphaerochaeta globosa (strain ATCC BAA-1886 / DSM 22777 / Buddy) TaxID=158189 RepID=F0RWF4_SPHGB|nr:diphosphate--fructose-6-phosphate 1-phosphotransferase [Sphaerochaeta globosa]ADY13585.1 diphosphate/fructose-6-phosphate 1-phosphotransferase [Sphaerochaeta globosa str. Buddy]
MDISPLQQVRYAYQPKLPAILRKDIASIAPAFGEATGAPTDADAIKALFPHTYGMSRITFTEGDNKAVKVQRNVGVILSGGQAPGGHNVISGLFDALKAANPENTLYGFKGGPSGILEDSYQIISSEFLQSFRNTGGFDIIGSGRTKLETQQQFEVCAQVCKKHAISALVIIGGDDSNTNAAVLAEYFLQKQHGIQVMGCPKTIDGDLKNEFIEISFGFDTATKTYSELIGNIARDANSAKKYWHFIKLMGRSASHIALECALQTQPNVCLISEEVEANKQSLVSIVEYIAQTVRDRAEDGNNFGVVLIPEGLVEFIPEIKALIDEINHLLSKEESAFNALSDSEQRIDFVSSRLSNNSREVFTILPDEIQKQLLMDRDPHGNVQVSRIETDKLLSTMVDARLKQLKAEHTYKGKFSSMTHFFGYEGRCAFPTNFDADYCYSLGYNAFCLIAAGVSGYLSSITNLCAPANEWNAGGIPITMMMNMEVRHGEKKPVIKKALVELQGKPFKYFAEHRAQWARKTCFTYPGAVQYFGPAEVCDRTTVTLTLEQSN